MDQVYSSQDAIPLFGIKSREVARISTEEIEIISLGQEGFEKNQSWFWFSFEWTIGWLLAEYIRLKSSKVALDNSSQPETFIQENGQDGNHILNRARQSFGHKRIRELFQLKIIGFNSSSPLLRHFCEHVAEAGALDDVYNALGSFDWNGQRIYPFSFLPDKWSNFYLSCPNGQSVRNRYRQVARLYKNFGGGKTLSIACGSAQPLIHALYALKAEGDDKGTELILTDVSDESLSLAVKRAEQAGVSESISCRRVSFLKLNEYFAGEKFDLVEACGILDYLPDDRAISILEFSLKSLKKGGRIIVSNMNRTRGANLLLKMYNWPIIYRAPEKFGRLIKRAGGKSVKVYVEPWGIHLVATASNCD